MIIREEAKKNDCNVVLFRFKNPSMSPDHNGIDEDSSENKNDVSIISKLDDSFFNNHISGETRVLLGAELSEMCNSPNSLSYRLVVKDKTFLSSNDLPLRPRRLLHLTGSTSSEFYESVANLYCCTSVKALTKKDRFTHVVAHVHRDGTISISRDDPSETSQFKDAPRSPFPEAISKIAEMKFDAVVPHMFDYTGLTAFRSLFELLNIPLIGCSGSALALSTNKMRTVAVAAKAGVPVAESEVVLKGETISLEPPVVIKPTEEDNSLGISLVRTKEELSSALNSAFKFGDEVLVERFIPLGREMRVGVIENANGEFQILPALEYFLPEDKPIRTPENKFNFNASGSMSAFAKVAREVPQLDDTLKNRLESAVKIAHRALGCRDYSLYDFRVDPQGNPFMLESCLYCSFSPTSAISLMWEAMGTPYQILLERCVEWAIARRVITSSHSSPQGNGMKAMH